MALTKVRAGGLTLSDNFAFTGTVTGASDLVKIYTQSGTSAVSSIDITDTYINSTYDTYYIVGNCLPSTDGVGLELKLKDSAGIISGNTHSLDMQMGALGELSDGQDHCRLNYSTIGNSEGEGTQFSFYLQHVNSSTIPCAVIAFGKTAHTGAQPEGFYVVSGLTVDQRDKAVKGFNLAMSSGNIASNNLTIYGIVK